MLGLTSGEFADAARRLGLSPSNAVEAYRAFHRAGKLPPPWAHGRVAPVVNTLHEQGTTKFIQRHEDGLETESVVLPYLGATGRPRNTLCLSSQIGCAMGCRFCETAQMGLMRNLAPSQIAGQWWAATHALEPNKPSLGRIEQEPPRQFIDNIVFMGMGEPMDNLDNVIQAIRVLSDRNGPAIAPARISVSTVGRVEGIRRLADLARTPGFRKLRLAVSINAPNDEVRAGIMPINRSTPMAAVMEAMLMWPTDGRQRVLIEYVLIPGVNDRPEHADQLCEYLKPLKCTVNAIPYNPRRESPWPAPSEEIVRAFVQRVHENGQFIKRRQTLGRSVMAACGQLGNPTIRGRRVLAAP
jgi:23S rRNA (adenine2503-C2)-methyltransferase